MKEKKTCAVILAAGTSSRMGQSKQLLPLEGKPLLEHVIQTALKGGFADVYTVVGHASEKIQSEINIQDRRHHWLINENYMYGQSTSVKKAFEHIKLKYDNVMILLGDLPFIRTETINIIYSEGRHLSIKQTLPFIIRPTHQNKAGHPVFIGNVTDQLIEQLEGDSGFKSLKNLFDYKKLIEVDDDGINFDIDTKEQYEVAMERVNIKN